MTHVSLDDLYTQFISLITSATGRSCWRKGGMQTTPSGTYATLQFTALVSNVVDPVTDVLTPEEATAYSQVAWGQSYIDGKVEFFRSASNNSAMDAAIRFARSLQLEARLFDIYSYCGLVGGQVHVIDVSSMFRADIEPRTEVRFQLLANISNPLPLPNTDITDIGSVDLFVYRNTDDTENLVIEQTIPEEEGD